MIESYRLSLLCAGLAAVIAAGFLFVLLGSKDAPASFVPFKDGRATGDRADRLVAEILKRPLFTQDRKPPEARIVKAEPPQLQGRLAGVMMRSDLRVALFTRPGGRPVSVKEGEVIDGWTASRIETGEVVLTSSFGEKVVKLTNGSAEEVMPGHRPAEKAMPTKNQPAKPGQNPAPGQKPQQLANRAVTTGQK
jgi:hypothetical protein